MSETSYSGIHQNLLSSLKNQNHTRLSETVANGEWGSPYLHTKELLACPLIIEQTKLPHTLASRGMWWDVSLIISENRGYTSNLKFSFNFTVGYGQLSDRTWAWSQVDPTYQPSEARHGGQYAPTKVQWRLVGRTSKVTGDAQQATLQISCKEMTLNSAIPLGGVSPEALRRQ